MNHIKNLADKMQAFQDAAEKLNEAWSNAVYSEANKSGQIDDITNKHFPDGIEVSFRDFVMQICKWCDYSINELNKKR